MVTPEVIRWVDSGHNLQVDVIDLLIDMDFTAQNIKDEYGLSNTMMMTGNNLITW